MPKECAMAVFRRSAPGAEGMLLALPLDRVEAECLRRLAEDGEGAPEAVVRIALREYLDGRDRAEHRRRVARAILTGEPVPDPAGHDGRPGSGPAVAPLHSRDGGQRGTPLIR
jgi:hypothetical protein